MLRQETVFEGIRLHVARGAPAAAMSEKAVAGGNPTHGSGPSA
jgi:hypothetical protein